MQRPLAQQCANFESAAAVVDTDKAIYCTKGEAESAGQCANLSQGDPAVQLQPSCDSLACQSRKSLCSQASKTDSSSSTSIQPPSTSSPSSSLLLPSLLYFT